MKSRTDERHRETSRLTAKVSRAALWRFIRGADRIEVLWIWRGRLSSAAPCVHLLGQSPPSSPASPHRRPPVLWLCSAGRWYSYSPPPHLYALCSPLIYCWTCLLNDPEASHSVKKKKKRRRVASQEGANSKFQKSITNSIDLNTQRIMGCVCMAKGFICNVCALCDQLLQSKLRSIPEWIQGTNSFKWIEVTMKGILRCKYGDMNGTMLLQAIAGLGREDSCLCTEEHSKATCFCSWARAVWHLKLIEFFWRKTKRSTRHHYITHLSCRRIKRCHNVCIITQGTKQAESAQSSFVLRL